MSTHDDALDATQEAVELADELGIDLANVVGTGQGGRILKGDVADYAEVVTAAPGESAGETDEPEEPAPENVVYVRVRPDCRYSLIRSATRPWDRQPRPVSKDADYLDELRNTPQLEVLDDLP